jgi:general secretion pathway protein G
VAIRLVLLMGLLSGAATVAGATSDSDGASSPALAVGSALAQAESVSARAEMDQLSGFIDTYLVLEGVLPATLADLTAPSPGLGMVVAEHVPPDPWGREYTYRPLGRRTYVLSSRGADGQEGTEDDVYPAHATFNALLLVLGFAEPLTDPTPEESEALTATLSAVMQELAQGAGLSLVDPRIEAVPLRTDVGSTLIYEVTARCDDLPVEAVEPLVERIREAPTSFWVLALDYRESPTSPGRGELSSTFSTVAFLRVDGTVGFASDGAAEAARLHVSPADAGRIFSEVQAALAPYQTSGQVTHVERLGVDVRRGLLSLGLEARDDTVAGELMITLNEVPGVSAVSVAHSTTTSTGTVAVELRGVAGE